MTSKYSYGIPVDKLFLKLNSFVNEGMESIKKLKIIFLFSNGLLKRVYCNIMLKNVRVNGKFKQWRNIIRENYLRLEKVIIEIFRSFKQRVTVDINDIASLIGKNDIGKSTILEVLEIFFNKSLVKIGREDFHTEKSKIILYVIFQMFLLASFIDSTVVTTLQQESLFMVKIF